ncbi:hypothetical protein LTR62_003072 [Meristemomyces frigidus]|uniref:Zn(2)-C6 fungal-type domain-containing protein n=1 Tax=Meristemomyces frigidus TaxID=1508187 RepID=A0AAN7TQA4_9PEZI|nr:hypothetical protein LTR62_003072 [Meristemomyces frigidus]
MSSVPASPGPYFNALAQKRPAPDDSEEDGRSVRSNNVSLVATNMDLEPSLHQHSIINSNLVSTQALATQACSTCKRQKRRCDKSLPQCSLCIRIGRPCNYTDEARATAPSSEDFVALRREVAELRGLLSHDAQPAAYSTSGSDAYFSSNDSYNADHGSGPNNTATANGQMLAPVVSQNAPSSLPLYFLDNDVFKYSRLQIQMPYIKPPSSILASLGNSLELRIVIEHYFSTVHMYFPIISKIRLYQHLANPMHEPGADIALLFSAMKLACYELADGEAPQTQLYHDVKSAYAYIESQDGLSVQLIQSLLLIALYEIGHAIYPAAYLSVGHAARLGHAMGIHERDVPQILQRPTTWTEQEERRRVWWAVVLLDRFVNIGSRGKPFASADPSLDTHLPTDDSSWDQGLMLVAAPLALSASPTTRASAYARQCQAAHLLGKILHHISDTTLPLDYRFEEAIQLNKTTRALALLLPNSTGDDESSQFPAFYSSIAISYSALLTLYDAYSCTSHAIPNGPETQLQMQNLAIEGMREFSNLVRGLAGHVKTLIEREGLEQLPVFVIEAFYQAAANYAWYVRESSDPECGVRLGELKEVLGLCDRRWRVAGRYHGFVCEVWERGEFGTAMVRVEGEG